MVKRARTQKTALPGAQVRSGVGKSVATRPGPNAAATSVAILHLRIQQVTSLRAILTRLRSQESALEGTESGLSPTNQDFNPQVVTADAAALSQAQSQLRILQSLLTGQSTRPPFTRPVRRLSAAAHRLQSAVNYLHLAMVDIQAGKGGAAVVLARSADALRRARNALNRTQVLLTGVCAADC